tara:strand:+ start:201 stop:455 length:255 start_codon:yes stop_codon:yes gene_type:complete
MSKKNWLNSLRLNIHAPGTGFALILLALTQVPVAIKNALKWFVLDKHQIKYGKSKRIILKQICLQYKGAMEESKQVLCLFKSRN